MARQFPNGISLDDWRQQRPLEVAADPTPIKRSPRGAARGQHANAGERLTVARPFEHARPAANAQPPLPKQRVRSARVESVTELLASAPEAPPILVDELIRRGDRVLLAGPRGLGKSWMAMQLASALNTGSGLFLGTFGVKRSARVLMLLGESSRHAVHQRWQLFGGKTSGVFVNTDRRINVSVRATWSDGEHEGQRVRMQQTVAKLSESLEKTIKEHSIDVLIVDPWAVFYRGEENSNDQVETALNALADLIAHTGVAIVLVHHFGKESRANAEPEDMGRGASRLADWAAVRITMRPHFKPTSAAARQLGRHDARRYVDVDFLTRDTVSPDSITIEADPTTRRFSLCDDPPGGTSSVWPAQRSSEARRAADACRDAGGFGSDSEAGRALDVDPRTARRLLGEAERLALGVRSAGPRGRGKAAGWLWVAP